MVRVVVWFWSLFIVLCILTNFSFSDEKIDLIIKRDIFGLIKNKKTKSLSFELQESVKWTIVGVIIKHRNKFILVKTQNSLELKREGEKLFEYIIDSITTNKIILKSESGTRLEINLFNHLKQ